MGQPNLLNNRRLARVGFILARSVPPVWGLRLAKFIARRIAARSGSPLTRALRVNQWVSGGENFGPEELDQAVGECLEELAVAFYRLFHGISDPAALQELVDFSPAVEELIARSRERRHGLVVAGLHMAGFDLTLQAVAHHGMQVLAVSLPEANENETIEWQHELRRRTGLEILPASVANLRRSIERVAAGEMLVTGIDRPMPDLKYRPVFFGRPAVLPTQHVYLALKARVPVMVMGAVRQADGRYHIQATPEISLRPDPDRRREMVSNAERILDAAQEIICAAPRQWAVPYPVWPEAAAEMP